MKDNLYSFLFGGTLSLVISVFTDLPKTVFLINGEPDVITYSDLYMFKLMFMVPVFNNLINRSNTDKTLDPFDTTFGYLLTASVIYTALNKCKKYISNDKS